MSCLNLWTYRDTTRHLLDYGGADVATQMKRIAKQAVLNAYREFATASRWSYFYQRGRINTAAQQVTGTVSYDSSTRQLILSGATWPSWVAFGTVTIQNITYEVAGSVSATVVTLNQNACPVADIASGTAYTLYRDTYPLPANFVAADEFISVGNFLKPVYMHPKLWLTQQRVSKSPATPRAYTFMGDPHYLGAMACRFYPAPAEVFQYDFIYQRRPRPLTIEEYATGTVSATAAATTVTGVGTAWGQQHVGCSIRFSANGTDFPEGLAWDTPFQEERTVVSVESATSLTVDSALASTYTAALYCLSDPVDLEEGAMLTGFLRCCESQVAISRIMKNEPTARASYREALILAREADSRNFADRVAGTYGSGQLPLRYMPAGPDQS